MTPPPPDLILDSVLAGFQNAAAVYFPSILINGANILWTLMLLQVCITFATAQKVADDAAELLGHITMSMIPTLICLWVVDHDWTLGNGLMDGAQQLAGQISGQSPATLTPSGFYTEGQLLIGHIYDARSWGMWFHPINDLTLWGLTLAAQIFWGLAAIYYMFILVSARFLITLGPLVICWAGIMHTESTLYAWLTRVFSSIVLIVSVLCCGAICMELGKHWIADLDAIGPAGINAARVWYAEGVLMECVTIAFVMISVPTTMAVLVRSNMASAGSHGDAGQMTGTAYRAATSGIRSVTRTASATRVRRAA